MGGFKYQGATAIGLMACALAQPNGAGASPSKSPRAQAQSQGQAQSQIQDQTQRKPSEGVVNQNALIWQPSLGELAREERAQRAKSSGPVPRLFTNDNLPRAAGGLSIVGPSNEKESTSASADDEGRSANRLRIQASEAKQRLDTHQRELSVLQQKLGESQVQYYPNPNDILHQEYSRDDINRLTQAIDQKKQQVEADQQALSEAEDELAQRGLAATAPEGAQHALTASQPDLTGVPKGSEQYWRLRFKAARQTLAKAQEQEKLAEDELALLQSQQAHEIASGTAGNFEAQVSAKKSELESKRTAVEQAQRDLDALDEEFKSSGSPQDWSAPE